MAVGPSPFVHCGISILARAYPFWWLEVGSESFDSGAMDADAIRRRLDALDVAPLNLQMVAYWLSLAEQDMLPRRDAVDPNAAGELLLGCGLFDVKPGESVTCRIAGMVLKLVFGPDVAGKDWLAVTPARHRAQRLARYSAVAQGAIGVGRRMAFVEGHDSVKVEEVMLPFRSGEDGCIQVLVHTDWRPAGADWLGVDPTYAVTLADEFHLVDLG